MTSNAKYLVLGTALLALSGYSMAGTTNDQSTTASDAPPVVVTGTLPTDHEIRAEVLKRIAEKPALGTENIDVQSFDRDVYLYGLVTSRMDSEEAEAVARTVPGVRNVYNALGFSGA